MINPFIEFVRSIYSTKNSIPLHEPIFRGREKEYINDAIDSTYVSSVGQYVDRFEKEFAQYVGSKYAIATVNGTSALHVALKLVGVSVGHEVITQPLTFAATCNAIKYCGATPLLLDIDAKTLGLSAVALSDFLSTYAKVVDGVCINDLTDRPITACIPMHTFGHPLEVDKIVSLCKQWKIPVVEDAAEALGSYFKGQHVGTFGKAGVFSFNGNKIITSGGGGMLVTDDESIAAMGKHLTTTAKIAHPWEYHHDRIGYNYRMPNLNAALGLAQLEMLPRFLDSKRRLAHAYMNYFQDVSSVMFHTEPPGSISNYWLNSLIFDQQSMRDEFLKITNESGIMTRPVWRPMHYSSFYESETSDLPVTDSVYARIVNLPSTPIGSEYHA